MCVKIADLIYLSLCITHIGFNTHGPGITAIFFVASSFSLSFFISLRFSICFNKANHFMLYSIKSHQVNGINSNPWHGYYGCRTTVATNSNSNNNDNSNNDNRDEQKAEKKWCLAKVNQLSAHENGCREKMILSSRWLVSEVLSQGISRKFGKKLEIFPKKYKFLSLSFSLSLTLNAYFSNGGGSRFIYIFSFLIFRLVQVEWPPLWNWLSHEHELRKHDIR